jgi:hypothetical protein
MSIMTPLKTKSCATKAQMYLDFIDEPDFKPVTKKRGRPPKPKTEMPAPKQVLTQQPEQPDFKALCMLLHDLAQRHVSRINFRDFTALVRCTKLLIGEGLPIEPAVALVAPLAAQTEVLVTADPKYRLMRNRAIAGLATIADLSSKAPAKGSEDYQRGMRAAFQQASEVAAFFLEDFLEVTKKESSPA